MGLLQVKAEQCEHYEWINWAKLTGKRLKKVASALICSAYLAHCFSQVVCYPRGITQPI